MTFLILLKSIVPYLSELLQHANKHRFSRVFGDVGADILPNCCEFSQMLDGDCHLDYSALNNAQNHVIAPTWWTTGAFLGFV